ncbi:MAG TPA: RNA methyltransferase PUA domain-containing protein, partial [Wenzhouxiangella sp.]
MRPSINPKPRLARVYTSQALALGEAVTLEDGPAKHLLTVLRHQPGDSVIVFNGDGAEYVGRIQQGERAKACVVQLEHHTSPAV